jgi:hypothetical protein
MNRRPTCGLVGGGQFAAFGLCLLRLAATTLRICCLPGMGSRVRVATPSRSKFARLSSVPLFEDPPKTRWEKACERRQLFRDPWKDVAGGIVFFLFVWLCERLFGSRTWSSQDTVITAIAAILAAFALPKIEASIHYLRIPRLELEAENLRLRTSAGAAPTTTPISSAVPVPAAPTVTLSGHALSQRLAAAKQEPPPRSERVYLSHTPAELIQIYGDGRTTAEGDREFAPLQGKWITIESEVRDVRISPFSVVVLVLPPPPGYGHISLTFSLSQKSRLEHLRQGDRITAEGAVASANPLALDHCELL